MSFPPSVLYVDWTTASKNFSPFILFHFHAFSEKVRPITGGVMRFAVLRFLANFCLVFPVLQSSFSHWYYFIKNFKIHTDQNPSKINADILPVKTVGHIKINESISFPRFLVLQCSLFYQFLLARGVYNLFLGWSATFCFARIISFHWVIPVGPVKRLINFASPRINSWEVQKVS